jgi:hypothetical protein
MALTLYVRKSACIADQDTDSHVHGLDLQPSVGLANRPELDIRCNRNGDKQCHET